MAVVHDSVLNPHLKIDKLLKNVIFSFAFIQHSHVGELGFLYTLKLQRPSRVSTVGWSAGVGALNQSGHCYM